MKKIDKNTYQFNRKETIDICCLLNLVGQDKEEKCKCEDYRICIEDMLESEDE